MWIMGSNGSVSKKIRSKITIEPYSVQFQNFTLHLRDASISEGPFRTVTKGLPGTEVSTIDFSRRSINLIITACRV